MPHAEDYASYSRNTTNSFNESTPSSDETTSFEFTDRVCISTVLDQVYTLLVQPLTNL